MDKTKKSLLDDCREHLVFAIGSAAGAGEHETAVRINAILIDLDIACEMCYTGKNARKARKTEEKTMKIYGRKITNEDMQNIAEYMDDAIREELHGKLAPCSNEKFLREYIKRDPEILEILRNEFDFSE